MDMPAMSVNGVVPVFSPLLILFGILFVAGALIVAFWRLRRNLLLLRQGHNPFHLAHFAHLLNSAPKTLLPHEKTFLESRAGRLGLALVLAGLLGIFVMLMVGLFAR